MVERHRPDGNAKRRAGLDQRRYQDRWDTDPKTFGIEPFVADRVVGRRGALRRRHMVVISAVLIVGGDQQRVLPVLAAAQRIVKRRELTVADIVVQMLAIAPPGPFRLEEGQSGQIARGSRGLEIRKFAEMGFRRLLRVGEIQLC
jgi:hypothetical protein